jgi:hypothetical protein
MTVITISTLTCPSCGTKSTRVMPQDACVMVARCQQCYATLRPKPGDCCVFCSYGDMPCPPMQQPEEDS